MPEFGNAYKCSLAAKRKLTHSELVRAIRFMIAAEYEAIQLYEQLAESSDNCLARKVLRDVTNEEKEHVGEFLRLLRELAPDEEAFYREGIAETEQAIAELGDKAACCRHEIASCKQPDEGASCSTPADCAEQQGHKTCDCDKDNDKS